MEAALEVASNLLPADRLEVEEGHGIDSTEALVDAVQKPSCGYFVVPNGKTAGMAGVAARGAFPAAARADRGAQRVEHPVVGKGLAGEERVLRRQARAVDPEALRDCAVEESMGG